MNPYPYGQPPQLPNQQQNIGFTTQQTPYPPYPTGPQSQMSQPPYPPSFAPGLPSQNPPSYPPANPNPGYPSYPQTQGYPSAYPPQAPQGYPPAPNANPGYPSYPPTQGYPSAYPPQTSQGYPPAPNAAPGYPGQGYPPAPANTGYPPAPGSTGYPPAQANTGYPPAQANTGYPPAQANTGYPPAPASTGYPPYQPVQAQQAYSAYSPVPSQQGYPTQPNQPSPQHIPPGSAPSAPRMQAYQERPTVVPMQPFDPVSDCQVLRKAMKGFGTDEQAIVNVLCKRTNVQRLQLIQTYKTSFGKDLVKDLKSELGGRFEDVIVALMMQRHDYIATTIHKAIAGIGTKERSLVDCVCTATNEEIRAINASYIRLFGRPMEKDLMSDTSGHFCRLLVSTTAAGRMENQPADPAMAANDVRALHEAGVKKFGTDEAVFNQILCLRSYDHLRLVFQEYERQHGMSFEKVIEREFSGDVESGLKAVVSCAKNRAAYFAHRLQDSFRGAGTKDEDLIFIIVTRCEIDLQNIKDEYQRNYNKSLAAAITSETSGDYKKALLALCGN